MYNDFSLTIFSKDMDLNIYRINYTLKSLKYNMLLFLLL